MYIIRIWTEAESRNVNFEVKKGKATNISCNNSRTIVYDIVKKK